MKTIKGIYNRSLKRGRDYMYDDTVSTYMFFPTNEVCEFVEDLKCGNIDEAISVLASKIDSEAPSVEFMWNLAVLAFYEGDVPSVPTNKNDALVRRLISEISRHKDEEHSWDEEFVFRQLDDFLFYIDHANRLEEIRLCFVGNKSLKLDMGEDFYGYFSELSDMQMEEGWRLKWKCRIAKSFLSDYCVRCDGFKNRRIHAIDEKGNEDKAVFRHIVVENTVMGGWCILLYMQKYMGLSVDWLVNKGTDSPFSIKPEDLSHGTDNNGDALDLFLPKSRLPYGKATMLGDDKCRIDLVFNHKSGKGQSAKRIHAALLLVNNRLVGLNAEEVKKKHTNFKNK